ncbi:MAG: hypothetical protein ACOC0O_07235 [Spirochaetota bacterium]
MEVRGSILQSLCDFLVDRYGEGNYRDWLSTLPPESRRHYEGKIAPGTFYPLHEGLVEPLQILLDRYYNGLPAGARALGFYNAEKALTGFLKFVVKRGSPGFIIRQANSILQKYYLPCESEVPVNEKGRAIVRVTRFDEPHLVVDYRIQGWMEKALEVSGCSNIRVRIRKSMARSDEVTEFEGTWS